MEKNEFCYEILNKYFPVECETGGQKIAFHISEGGSLTS